MKWLEDTLDLLLYVLLVIICAPVYFVMNFIDWLKER